MKFTKETDLGAFDWTQTFKDEQGTLSIFRFLAMPSDRFTNTAENIIIHDKTSNLKVKREETFDQEITLSIEDGANAKKTESLVFNSKQSNCQNVFSFLAGNGVTSSTIQKVACLQDQTIEAVLISEGHSVVTKKGF